MVVVLKMLPLLSVALCALAMGDEFATCDSGSSCVAWNAFVDDPAKEVLVQEKVKGAGAQYYRIVATFGGTSFTKFRRYSEFNTLKDKLGPVAAGLAPFPPKLYLNNILERFWPSTLDDRRAQLEVWLNKVLNHEDSKGPWADDLFIFLDPKNSAAIFKSGISMPPDANKICKEEIHYFGIDVGADKVRVWRRYSDFYAFQTTLKNLGAKEEDFGVDFPEKILWSKFIKMWESKLEERRRGLESWLQQVKIHTNSAPGGIWADGVNNFLDPVENKDKLSWDCLLENTAAWTHEQLEKFYNFTVTKVDELKYKVHEKVEELMDSKKTDL